MIGPGEASGHLKDGASVTCRTCGRVTVERGRQAEQRECKACREAPHDNCWAKIAGAVNPPPPRRNRCENCGRSYYGPRNIPGGAVEKCMDCLREKVPPPVSAATSQETQAGGTAEVKPGPATRGVRHRRDVLAFIGATCANSRGVLCHGRAGAPCIVLHGQPCQYLEQSAVADARLVPQRFREGYPGPFFRTAYAFGKGRRCADCGEPVAKRRRFCDGCRDRRRRAATKASVHRHRGAQHVSS